MLKILTAALLAWLSLAPVPPGAAEAAAGPWAEADMVEARLIAAVEGTGELGEIPLGLQVRLAPGWKTYWRSPGDAGLPPTLDWSGSANLDSAEMAWPAPHRFTLFGIETFGYDGEVVFPVTAVPARPGEPMELKAAADLLVCSDICVPQRFDLALTIPAGPAAPGPETDLIARAQAAVPVDGAVAGLTVERVAAQEGEPSALVVEATAREPFVVPDLFVEAGEDVAFGAPEIAFAERDRRITVRLPLASAPGGGDISSLVGKPVTLTLVDGDRAAEFRAVVAEPAPAPAGAGLAAMLAMAVLGGLLLNLMPCVLPVLSLKLLSVAKLGGAAPGRVRAGFLASAAGIVVSFLVLATGLVFLKAAGAAVGWGIQFQQPLFLIFMTVLVTLFAANLWGLFEVPLPRALADAVGARAPEKAGQGGSLAGHFASGAFATLLATPCSAPFLGTAVGFALARGPVEIYAIFAALGLGLALPWLGVAAWPRLARALPRPGRWMVALRRVLGAALALTGLWLLSVLAAQEAPVVALAVGGLMAGLVLVLALRRRLPEGTRPAGGLVALALALAAFAMPGLPGGPAEAAPESVPAKWAAFDRAAIDRHVEAGRVVFVDVTADWCITCQANKALVLNRGTVAERLFGGGTVAMQADWTRPDPAIAEYLASYGRYGIPFDAVYGPGAPEGIVLPELLTEGAVLEALDRAAASPRVSAAEVQALPATPRQD